MKHLIALITMLCCGMATAGRVHFQTFFHQIRPYMKQYLRENCSAEYEQYMHANANFSSANTMDCVHCAAAPVTGCLLQTMKEVDKANMASAAVILGILPTTLSLAGSNTAETGLLSLRRPFLAFLLGAGAPAVNPARTFYYGDPHEILQLRPRSMGAPNFGRWSGLILAFEYLLALTSVGNLALVSYQLCVRTICSFSQDTAYLPALWAFLAAAIHVAGAIAVALRTRLTEADSNYQGKRPHIKERVRREFSAESIWRRIRNEFRLSSDQSDAVLELREENHYFMLLAWATASGTVVHIMFGTLVFSSIVFITTEDAVDCALQFLGSTVLCRLILMFELSGMRKSVRVRKEKMPAAEGAYFLEAGGRVPTW